MCVLITHHPFPYTTLYRSIYPSTQSVVDANKKIIAAIKCVIGSSVPPMFQAPKSKGTESKMIKIGMSKILDIVSLLGKFIKIFPPYAVFKYIAWIVRISFHFLKT